MNCIMHYDSALGGITLASNGETLTGLWFDDQKYFGTTIPAIYEEKTNRVLSLTVKWLDIYFSGNVPDFMPQVCLQGTPFQNEVWNILQTIPYGQTVSYGELALLVAKHRNTDKMSARAVGNAVGHNPISLIVPCHRVIGADGSLRGYAGGTDRKRKLLLLEGMSR